GHKPQRVGEGHTLIMPRHPARPPGAERHSSAAGPAGVTSPHEKPSCRPRQLQRLVRRPTVALTATPTRWRKPLRPLVLPAFRTAPLCFFLLPLFLAALFAVEPQPFV